MNECLLGQGEVTVVSNSDLGRSRCSGEVELWTLQRPSSSEMHFVLICIRMEPLLVENGKVAQSFALDVPLSM